MSLCSAPRCATAHWWTLSGLPGFPKSFSSLCGQHGAICALTHVTLVWWHADGGLGCAFVRSPPLCLVATKESQLYLLFAQMSTGVMCFPHELGGAVLSGACLATDGSSHILLANLRHSVVHA